MIRHREGLRPRRTGMKTIFKVLRIGRDIAMPRYRIESGGLANLEHLEPINEGHVSRHS